MTRRARRSLPMSAKRSAELSEIIQNQTDWMCPWCKTMGSIKTLRGHECTRKKPDETNR